MTRFALARQLILQAGQRLRQAARSPRCPQQKTGPQDLVTRWDREIEQFLREGVARYFPQDGVVGEELPAQAGGEYVWYLDPIDGTTNFVLRGQDFAVSVACWQAGRPVFGLVLDVMAERLYEAQADGGAFGNGAPLYTTDPGELSSLLLLTPDMTSAFLTAHPCQQPLQRLARRVCAVRCLGSVSLELCALAAGQAGAFVALHSCPWDHNAARVILQQAGGAIAALRGGPLPVEKASPVLAAATPALLARLTKELAEGTV